jgi:chromosomal replication initiation ATPase DnaA
MKTEEIIKKACEINHITVDEVKSKRRYRPLPDTRKQICAIIKENSSFSLQKIGSYVNVDHSMVLDYKKEHKNLMDTDKLYKQNYIKLKIFTESLKIDTDVLVFKNSIKYSIKYYGL